MNILIDNLLMQFFYISNATMCWIKKILYKHFCFFAQLSTAFLLEKFYMSLHSTKTHAKHMQNTRKTHAKHTQNTKI